MFFHLYVDYVGENMFFTSTLLVSALSSIPQIILGSMQKTIMYEFKFYEIFTQGDL